MFAGAIGQRAKNDRLDAALIAHYAEKIQPELTEQKSRKNTMLKKGYQTASSLTCLV